MNTELVVLLGAFIGFLGTLVSGFIVVWREVRGVHTMMNSRLDELLELTREQAHAKGVSDEKARSDRKR